MNVKLTVQETIVYTDEIVVNQPKDMTDDEFEKIIDKVEIECKYDSSKDVAYVLATKYGIEIVKQSFNFPDSPDRSELEITDLEDIK